MNISLRNQVGDMVQEAINKINLRQIFLMAITMVVAHSILITIFYGHYVHNNYADPEWHKGIIYAHSVMLVIIAVLGAASYCLTKQKKTTSLWASIIIEATSIGYILFGAVVTAIDQIAMPGMAITAYLIGCMAIAATLVKPPLNSFIEYSLSLILLFAILFWNQHDTSILLSIGVNSFFVVIIALTMIVIRWRSTVKTIEQEEYIKKQNQELEEKNQLLEYNAKHDFLTGLYNRREFVEVAEREIARNLRNGSEACGIIVDMDNFKQINDRYGHPTGDKVLQDVASAICSVLRTMDISARFGGEEFAILLPETTVSGGAIVAERVRKAIEELRITTGEEETRVTASLGVAPLAGAFKTFYNTADMALYQAKEKGRNQVIIADSH